MGPPFTIEYTARTNVFPFDVLSNNLPVDYYRKFSGWVSARIAFVTSKRISIWKTSLKFDVQHMPRKVAFDTVDGCEILHQLVDGKGFLPSMVSWF